MRRALRDRDSLTTWLRIRRRRDNVHLGQNMEYGLRALGARCIIAGATDKTINERLDRGIHAIRIPANGVALHMSKAGV